MSFNLIHHDVGIGRYHLGTIKLPNNCLGLSSMFHCWRLGLCDGEAKGRE